MPELPEVETVVRTLRPHVEGRTIVFAEEIRRPCVLKDGLPLAKAAGARIDEVTRRGKLVVMHLHMADGTSGRLLVHLRMTGRLTAAEACPADRTALRKGADKYVRAGLGLAEGSGQTCSSVIWFSDPRTFGRILLTTPERLEQWSFWKELGPEPLLLEGEALYPLMRSRASVKARLLDQHVIAGIGNIYADESLFRAGIHPKREAVSLSREDCARLLKALQDVLTLSIEQCGSSIKDYRDADGNVGAFQNSFAVYSRAGERCVRCGRILRKEKIAGRTSVFCPHCQKLPSSSHHKDIATK